MQKISYNILDNSFFAALLFISFCAVGIFIASAYIRYHLTMATTITITAPDAVQAGDTYYIQIYAKGFPFGAGVGTDLYNIRPIQRGWNTYIMTAPNETGLYSLVINLYPNDTNYPKICEIISIGGSRWMPPVDQCTYEKIDSAEYHIDIVENKQATDNTTTISR